MSEKALEGIRVLDVTQFFAGPYTGMFLADMGAEVIKIEPVGGDTTRHARPQKYGVSGYYSNLNRGKKSLTLNLKSKEGKQILRKLIEGADVLIENSRPGAMDRLGFSYEAVSAINERIIYASVSGFGQTGRYRERPGYDLIAQAMGGAMSICGFPQDPPTRGGVPAGDALGGMNAVIGILAALYYRQSSGRGQHIDVSLVDSIVSSLCSYTMYYLFDGELPQRIGNRYLFTYPYDSFLAADGDYVIACGTDAHFRALAGLIGRPELAEDPRFSEREARNIHHAPLKQILDDWGKDKRVADIVEAILSVGVPAAPILDFRQLSEDGHIREDRKMFVPVELPGEGGMIEVTNNPIRMSETDPHVWGPPAALGEQNEEILLSLGYDRDTIDLYRRRGIL